MNSLTIQLPLSEKELVSAKRLAEKWGFSSAEEALNALMRRLLSGEIDSTNIRLTKKAKDRYGKMDEDFKTGRNVICADNVDEFLIQLNA
jgi:hypothetical protein